MTRTDIARAICCPGGKCTWPQQCYATRPGEWVLVDMERATKDVAALIKGQVQRVYEGPPVEPLKGWDK